MAKGLIPIMHITTPPIIGLGIEDIMQAHDANVEETFTSTTRYTVPRKTKRNKIRKALRDRAAHGELNAVQVEDFIKLMDDHEWDVSFLVDTY